MRKDAARVGHPEFYEIATFNERVYGQEVV